MKLLKTAGLFLLTTSAGLAGTTDNIVADSDVPPQFSPPTEQRDYIVERKMIPMRDGVRLSTIILRSAHATGRAPIVLRRTPYGASRFFQEVSPNAAAGLDPVFRNLFEAGYICVFQDVRGRANSEGQYTFMMPPRGVLNNSMVDHATDTWDTIEWLTKNVARNNGRVGMVGVSYDGFLTLTALLEPHPALWAVAAINAYADGWMGDDWYHNGAFRQQEALDFVYRQTTTRDWSPDGVPYGSRDLYDLFLALGSAANVGRRYGHDQLPAWRRIIEHSSYDAFWREQALQDLLVKRKWVHPIPTMTVHGLFDQEDIFGPIAAYEVLERSDEGNSANSLVIGPWSHGQAESDGSRLGPLVWHQDTSRQFRNAILQRFWNEHLKSADAPAAEAVIAFDTGDKEWHDYDSWPPAGTRMRKLLLDRGNRATFDPARQSPEGPVAYVSDPAKPVPYRVRPNLRTWEPGSGWSEWLVDDQRQFETRPDVLTFTSEVLAEPVVVRGKVTANIVASTTGTDADWVVKVIDVYPREYPEQPELGGYELMISGNILRGRFRDGFSEPRPITPDKPQLYRWRLPDVSHTFRAGHRIMVQIQSSWFPLYDRNPQSYVANIAFAEKDDYQVATHTIYVGAGSGTYIELGVTSETDVNADSAAR